VTRTNASQRALDRRVKRQRRFHAAHDRALDIHGLPVSPVGLLVEDNSAAAREQEQARQAILGRLQRRGEA